MDRSSRFGSTICNYVAHLKLAFASAPELNSLTSLHTVTRRPVLQKVRDWTVLLHSSLSACKHIVSGSISLPSRGSFHRSLTVLFAIGHQIVFSLWRWSSYLHAGFHVSHVTLDTHSFDTYFAYEAFTLFRPPFQVCSTISTSTTHWVLNPTDIATRGLGCYRFARHY